MTLSGSSGIKLYQLFMASTCSDWLVSMPYLHNPWWACHKWQLYKQRFESQVKLGQKNGK